MSLIADGILIAACLTTAVYCFVLSRRLKRLANTEEGIGQQIRQFNAALDETRAAVNDIRGSARTASDRLVREIGQAKKLSASLAGQIAEGERVVARGHRTDDRPPTQVAEAAPPDAAGTAPGPVAGSADRSPADEVEAGAADLAPDDAAAETDRDGGPVRSDGELELGFVPDERPDGIDAAAEAPDDDDPTDPNDGAPVDGDDAPVARPAAPARAGGRGGANLLKVERVAL